MLLRRRIWPWTTIAGVLLGVLALIVPPLYDIKLGPIAYLLALPALVLRATGPSYEGGNIFVFFGVLGICIGFDGLLGFLVGRLIERKVFRRVGGNTREPES